MAARALSASCLAVHVFTFSPAPILCWENATLVSNKSVNVDAAKILMASHPDREGDNESPMKQGFAFDVSHFYADMGESAEASKHGKGKSRGF
jgi:hypothetical protein